jgi:hypothetical protein
MRIALLAVIHLTIALNANTLNIKNGGRIETKYCSRYGIAMLIFAVEVPGIRARLLACSHLNECLISYSHSIGPHEIVEAEDKHHNVEEESLNSVNL